MPRPSGLAAAADLAKGRLDLGERQLRRLGEDARRRGLAGREEERLDERDARRARATAGARPVAVVSVHLTGTPPRSLRATPRRPSPRGRSRRTPRPGARGRPASRSSSRTARKTAIASARPREPAEDLRQRHGRRRALHASRASLHLLADRELLMLDLHRGRVARAVAVERSLEERRGGRRGRPRRGRPPRPRRRRLELRRRPAQRPSRSASSSWSVSATPLYFRYSRSRRTSSSRGSSTACRPAGRARGRTICDLMWTRSASM